jgi:excisionase family DNA binding protein
VSAVIVLSPEELRAIVRDAVAEALAAGPRMGTAEDLLTLTECGAPIRTLRTAIKAGALPAVKTGREYRVRRTDLDAWLAARAVEPKPDRRPTPPDDPVSRALRTGALRVVGAA